MPSHGLLSCSIETGESLMRLREYGTKYFNRTVESYVAIPPNPSPFSIRVESSGYIAPGLAVFVYIDGVYQANRNKRGLVPPNSDPPGPSEVEFHLGQKEDLLKGGRVIARGWWFEKLNIANGDIGPTINEDVVKNLGTIEVVVMRCQDNPEYKKLEAERVDPWSFPKLPTIEHEAKQAKPKPRQQQQQAGKKQNKKNAKEAPTKKADDDNGEDSAGSEIGGLFGLFDGAGDERPRHHGNGLVSIGGRLSDLPVRGSAPRYAETATSTSTDVEYESSDSLPSKIKPYISYVKPNQLPGIRNEILRRRSREFLRTGDDEDLRRARRWVYAGRDENTGKLSSRRVNETYEDRQRGKQQKARHSDPKRHSRHVPSPVQHQIDIPSAEAGASPDTSWGPDEGISKEAPAVDELTQSVAALFANQSSNPKTQNVGGPVKQNGGDGQAFTHQVRGPTQAAPAHQNSPAAGVSTHPHGNLQSQPQQSSMPNPQHPMGFPTHGQAFPYPFQQPYAQMPNGNYWQPPYQPHQPHQPHQHHTQAGAQWSAPPAPAAPPPPSGPAMGLPVRGSTRPNHAVPHVPHSHNQHVPQPGWQPSEARIKKPQNYDKKIQEKERELSELKKPKDNSKKIQQKEREISELKKLQDYNKKIKEKERELNELKKQRDGTPPEAKLPFQSHHFGPPPWHGLTWNPHSYNMPPPQLVSQQPPPQGRYRVAEFQPEGNFYTPPPWWKWKERKDGSGAWELVEIATTDCGSLDEWSEPQNPVDFSNVNNEGGWPSTAEDQSGKDEDDKKDPFALPDNKVDTNDSGGNFGSFPAQDNGNGDGWGNTDNQNAWGTVDTQNPPADPPNAAWDNEDNDDTGNSGDGWGNGDTADNNAGDNGWGNDEKSSDGKKQKSKAKSKSAASTTIEEKPYTRSYWQQGKIRESGYSESKDRGSKSKGSRKREKYTMPEDPIYTVTEEKAKKKNVKHQVRGGKGAEQERKTYKPQYWDSLEEPYAVFRFKYRSHDMLKKILGEDVTETPEEYREWLNSLPKEQLVTEMMKKKEAGKLDSDNEDSGSKKSKSKKSKSKKDENAGDDAWGTSTGNNNGSWNNPGGGDQNNESNDWPASGGGGGGGGGGWDGNQADANKNAQW